jgi:glycerol kinase
MGLFAPAWMSKDAAKALKAVKNLTDQKKIAEAALKAPLETTRAIAVKS